jgi:PAS domain S-box-containing protein
VSTEQDVYRGEEERLALAIEVAEVGVWELWTETNDMYLSRHWFTMLGYEPEDLPHRYETWIGLLHPEDAGRVRNVIEQTIQAGADFSLEYRMRTRDDRWLWIRSSAKSAARDKCGKATRLIGVHVDVNELVISRLEREHLSQRRTEQARAGVEFAQELSAVGTKAALAERIVGLVRTRFGYHSVQLYRCRPAHDEVVLVASVGQFADGATKEGYTASMGHGAVGIAAATGRPVLVSNTALSPEWVLVPALADVKGELAVPIMLRGEVVAVLAVQSNVAGVLSQDDQLLLESISGPIALAIEDMDLRQEMEERLQELGALQRILTRQEWRGAEARHRAHDGFEYDRHEVRPVVQDASDDATSSHRAVSVPMDIAGDVVGVLGIYEDRDAPLSAQDRDLLRSISVQVTEALERAQLFENAQSRAGRERAIRYITDRMQRAADLESLMRIAAEELKRALGASRAYVRMGTARDLARGEKHSSSSVDWLAREEE